MTKIQILGTGCQKCRIMEQQVRKAAEQLEKKFEITKVEKIDEILKFGVMMTPALVIDGDVKIIGKSPGVEKLKKILGEL
ncbi:thioredoxin family protein [candidate division KSB1 bacterium]|nr:MAG: thioredoxin family protein [candidate division KSB1 bacterium]